jgi:hypothetical protein
MKATLRGFFLVFCGLFLAEFLAVQTAHACSEPDTTSEPTEAGPAGKQQQPEGELTPPGEGEGTGEITDGDAIVLNFQAGYDVDADPNRGYFGHPHLAYTEVVILDESSQSSVLERRVPVWDYEAADARTEESYDKIESLEIDPLPAGSYRFQTRAIFELHDSTIEGDPASIVFSVIQAVAEETPSDPISQDPVVDGPEDQEPPTSPTSQTMIGGCQLGPALPGANGLPWVVVLSLLGLITIRRS